MADRQQQKVFLSSVARTKLRDEAEERGLELSEIVEHLLVEGEYPAGVAVADRRGRRPYRGANARPTPEPMGEKT